MNHPKEWNEEEDNFDLTLSQRTEELYRIPNMEMNEEGLIEAAVLRLSGAIVTVGAKGVDEVKLRRSDEPRNVIHA